MSHTNITKKQHYVPKFYLRRFSDHLGKLQVLDIMNHRLGAPKHCSAVAYSHYFYAVETGIPDEASQHVEQWLQQFENVIAQEIQGIIHRILNCEHIDETDHHILAVFMCMLWLRSPNMRDQLNMIQEDVMKQIMKFYVPESVDRHIETTEVSMSDEERADLIHTMETGSYNLRFNNKQHLKFMTENLGFVGSGFANLFFGQKWKIYIARGKERFITSDAPVVEWCPPRQSFYGPTFLERNKYFALTPEIFIELTYPIGSDKVKRKTLFEREDHTVAVFNRLIVDHAHEFAYASNRKPLDDLISGHETPGVIKIAYFNQFK